MSNIDILNQRAASYDRKRDEATGKWSANNGDYVIQATGGLSDEEIALVIQRVTGEDWKNVLAVFLHMNSGLIRMNLNNKLRQGLLVKHGRPRKLIKRLAASLDKAKERWGEHDERVEFIQERLETTRMLVSGGSSKAEILKRIMKELGFD